MEKQFDSMPDVMLQTERLRCQLTVSRPIRCNRGDFGANEVHIVLANAVGLSWGFAVGLVVSKFLFC